MPLIIGGVAIFVVSVGVMVVSVKTFPPSARLVVPVIMAELICVSGALIGVGLDVMGLMEWRSGPSQRRMYRAR